MPAPWAKTLKRAGFDVEVGENLSKEAMQIVRLAWPFHSPLMLAALMIGHHLSISALCVNRRRAASGIRKRPRFWRGQAIYS
jgi:hypothetical protein